MPGWKCVGGNVLVEMGRSGNISVEMGEIYRCKWGKYIGGNCPVEMPLWKCVCGNVPVEMSFSKIVLRNIHVNIQTF